MKISVYIIVLFVAVHGKGVSLDTGELRTLGIDIRHKIQALIPEMDELDNKIKEIQFDLDIGTELVRNALFEPGDATVFGEKVAPWGEKRNRIIACTRKFEGKRDYLSEEIRKNCCTDLQRRLQLLKSVSVMNKELKKIYADIRTDAHLRDHVELCYDDENTCKITGQYKTAAENGAKILTEAKFDLEKYVNKAIGNIFLGDNVTNALKGKGDSVINEIVACYKSQF